jgi:hypothetical protein
MRWRGRQDGEAGGCLGPDQQKWTQGVVDDEAAGGTEAVRAEVGAVAVAGQDEQVRALRRGDDLAFDAAGVLGVGTGAAGVKHASPRGQT